MEMHQIRNRGYHEQLFCRQIGPILEFDRHRLIVSLSFTRFAIEFLLTREIAKRVNN